MNYKRNSEERLQRIKRAKCSLFNKTSDGCEHLKLQKRGDEVCVKVCKANECKACLYKLCPKIQDKIKKKK